MSRRHAQSVEECRCSLCVVHFNEIVGLITCESVRFRRSAKRRSGSWIVSQWSSPCESNNKEVEVGVRVECAEDVK